MLSRTAQLVDEQQCNLAQVDCPLVLNTKAGIAPMRSSQPYCLLATGSSIAETAASSPHWKRERWLGGNDILVRFIDNQSIVRLRRAVQIAKLRRTRVATAAAIAENFVSTQAKNDRQFVAMGMTSLPAKSHSASRTKQQQPHPSAQSQLPSHASARWAFPRASRWTRLRSRTMPHPSIAAEAQLEQIRCQPREATNSQRMTHTGGKATIARYRLGATRPSRYHSPRCGANSIRYRPARKSTGTSVPDETRTAGRSLLRTVAALERSAETSAQPERDSQSRPRNRRHPDTSDTEFHG